MVEEVQVVNNVAMDVSAVSQEQAASTEVIHNTSETMVEQANNLATESEQVADYAKPASPALAASIEAFKERSAVSSEISPINPIIPIISLEASPTLLIIILQQKANK